MATKKEQVYKCQVCTNEVKVTAEGVGILVCCNKPMELKASK
jgi:superoxide reductase